MNTKPGSGIMRRSPSSLPSTSLPCRRMQNFSPEALAQVAAYFQTLAEPVRLHLLNLLREGERSVGELAEATACSAANASRHLALLAQQGLLSREVRGTSVFYAIADPAVYELCNLVCDNLARRFERTAPQRAAFASSRPRVRRRVPKA